MRLEDRLEKDLEKRLKDNSLRTLKPESELIDFFSNDYLGLAKNQKLFSQINEAHQHYPFNGATGSRLLSGNSNLYGEIETQLADNLMAEAVLIFNAGYNANLAILSSIPKKGDTIIYDELAHACIKDGARLSLAKRFSFKHNNLPDLELKLQKAEGNVFVVVEAVYSMDGDSCPLEELIQLTKQYNANIVLDEAHTTGLYGPNSSGLSGKLNLQNDIFARIYTFGKAMGAHGAAIAGSKNLINYLINFARPFIYTTALPHHSIITIKYAFKFLAQNQELQQQVLNKVRLFNGLFRGKLSDRFRKIESEHPIQSIVIPGNHNVKKVTDHLVKQGFDVRPILSPTVKKGQERLRICLHVYNTDDDISLLIDTLAAL